MTGLLDTTSGQIWASEFCRIFDGWSITSAETAEPVEGERKQVDVGTMIGWFANAIETGKGHGPKGDPTGVLNAFLHFYHLDRGNAAIHGSGVRFSPVTFRLQEYLFETHPVEAVSSPEIEEVMEHNGKYQEDRGRE